MSVSASGASEQAEGGSSDRYEEGGDASEGEAASNNNQSLTLTRLSSLDQSNHSMMSSTNREHQCDVDVCHTHNVLVLVDCASI